MFSHKLELIDYDIPTSDIECWEKYPKHRWVYDLSRLCDAQDIAWNLFASDSLTYKREIIEIEDTQGVKYSSGNIFIKEPMGEHIYSEVFISKGEIKFTRYFDLNKNVCDVKGDIELRINAFVIMHFQKFSGIITVVVVEKNIYSAHLMSLSTLASFSPDAIKLIKKIYKKSI